MRVAFLCLIFTPLIVMLLFLLLSCGMTRCLHSALWSKRIPQVRLQFRHLPHLNRRVFRHHCCWAELRAGLPGLRAILVRRHAIYYENRRQQTSFPSMHRHFVGGGLERGVSMEPVVAPRAADPPAPSISRGLSTKRIFCVFSVGFFIVLCFRRHVL